MQPVKDLDRFPSRKHPRVKAFDYSSPNYFFLTVCTWNKNCILGSPSKLEDENPGVSQIIGQYKSFVTRKTRKISPHQTVWQTSFHDHVIRNQKDYERIWLYIDSNPQNWNKDCFFKDI